MTFACGQLMYNLSIFNNPLFSQALLTTTIFIIKYIISNSIGE